MFIVGGFEARATAMMAEGVVSDVIPPEGRGVLLVRGRMPVRCSIQTIY
jgi:hypothetical protein